MSSDPLAGESLREPELVAGVLSEEPALVESVESPAADNSQNAESGAGSYHFLHWSSLFFDIISRFRQYLIPLIFAFLSARNQDWFFGVLAGVFLIGSLMRTFVRYFTLQYGIANGELVVKQGLIFRSIRTVPTRKIQNVNLRQTIFHRVLGVYEVHVETASGQEAEVVLRVLARAQVDSLRQEIFASRPVVGTGTSSVKAINSSGEVSAVDRFGADVQVSENLIDGVAVDSTLSERLLLKIPAGWLVKVGLASNRGWLVVGVAIGLFFQFGSFDDERWIKQAINFIGNAFDALHLGFLQYVLLAVIGLILLKLFGIVWYFTRFFGYRLTRAGDDLRITCGLLTSYSATIPRKRIQVISVQSSWLMRQMGVVRICIETAGGGGNDNDKENSHTQITRSSFVPALAEDDVPRLISELRPDLKWVPEDLHWVSAAGKTAYRRARINLIVSLVITGVVSWFYWPWGLGVILLLGPWSLLQARLYARSLKYARTADGVIFRGGVLTRKTSLAFFDRVQTLSVSQSPFDRRWRMAAITIDTAAAGPADHPLTIPYLDAPFVLEEIEALRYHVATHRPQWG